MKMNPTYKERLNNLRQRLKSVEELFENPVMTAIEGKMIEDEESTLRLALRIWLGEKIDISNPAKKKGSQISLDIAVKARNGK